ncbi:MAG: hypothetical protein HYR85_01260 [Planctomycetes bacterium]|nr:hypothetical protein [Planctomycetota bacterium]MBI3843155.1 hypothetical protein [Planctomycetota bacterium]
MNSAPTWQVRVSKPAVKNVERAPRDERERLLAVLDEMAIDPFVGDVLPLKGHSHAFRRRVGSWRILFDVYRAERVVDVVVIERRSTTTYRR